MSKQAVRGICLFCRCWVRFLPLFALVGVSTLWLAKPIRGAAAAPKQALNLVFVGDTGTGDRRQLEVASQMVQVSKLQPLDYVVLLGDNVYGGDKGSNFGKKFLDVYAPLLAAGVQFHAALGNHDVEDCQVASGVPLPADAAAYVDTAECWAGEEIQLKEFGYPDGLRYYSFNSAGAPPLVEIFVLDSNTLRGDGDDDDEGGASGAGADPAQLQWLKAALDSSTAVWKILATHHPIHSPKGRRIFGLGHKPETGLREALEPLIDGRIDVVFQGHNHLYARMLPRKGVRYFVSGGGGQSPYRFNPDPDTVPRRDRGKFNNFVFARVSEEEFQYCVIDKDGGERDGGWFRKGDAADTPFPKGECPPLATALEGSAGSAGRR